MRLNAQKTAGTLAAMYITQIVCWAAGYFWHVTVPDTVATSLTGLCALILIHVPFLETPTSAG